MNIKNCLEKLGASLRLGRHIFTREDFCTVPFGIHVIFHAYVKTLELELLRDTGYAAIVAEHDHITKTDAQIQANFDEGQ